MGSTSYYDRHGRDLLACHYGPVGLIICGYSTSSGLLASWFGNATIQQIIWVMALTGAVTESGAVNVLARKVLKIRALKGHPMRLIVGLF